MKVLLSKILLITALALVSSSAFSGDRVSLPSWPEPVGEKCVEPTELMRREHMKFIMHQRDETMYDGIRGITAKHSLKDCIDCHAGYDNAGKAIPINEEGQFCESCHNYTAVSIDCFGCHRTTPGEENKMRQSMANPHQ